MNDGKERKVRAVVERIDFSPERVQWDARALGGASRFTTIATPNTGVPQLGDVFIYTISADGMRIVGDPEPEAPLLSEQKFNEWIERRMGRLSFEGETWFTQQLVRDAFMAGREEVRPDTEPRP